MLADAKDEFDLLQIPQHRRVQISSGTCDDEPAIYDLIERYIPPPFAVRETLRQVAEHNQNAITVVRRGDRLIGFHAALFLNPLGLERLLLGEFDTLRPDLRCLVPTGERPAAIYLWLAICPGLAIEGLLHVADRLRQTPFSHANLFSRPVTPDGERRLLAFGYRRVVCGTPDLHRYIRRVNRAEPLAPPTRPSASPLHA